MGSDREDRPKKSWREIDKRKDRSSHRQDEPKNPFQKKVHRQRSYRSQLDRLFESGKIGKLLEENNSKKSESTDGEKKIKALRCIKNAQGRDAITKAVDSYCEKYELPDDIEILEKILEHRNIERQIEAIESLLKIIQEEKPKRTRSMIGQLKLIRDMDEDQELTQLATQLLEELGT